MLSEAHIGRDIHGERYKGSSSTNYRKRGTTCISMSSTLISVLFCGCWRTPIICTLLSSWILTLLAAAVKALWPDWWLHLRYQISMRQLDAWYEPYFYVNIDDIFSLSKCCPWYMLPFFRLDSEWLCRYHEWTTNGSRATYILCLFHFTLARYYLAWSCGLLPFDQLHQRQLRFIEKISYVLIKR